MAAHRTLARQPAPPERKAAPPAPARSPAPAPSTAQLLQRRLGNQGTVALVARSGIRVSSPHDASEREAVTKAAEVMRMPAPAPGPIAVGSARVQRCACENCACHLADRQAAGPEPAKADVGQQIQAGMTGGSPLPGGVRTFMEPRFGADFSRVRVHDGANAAALSKDLNAHAFTVGNHVFFGAGQYRPETAAGKELIAHELTHTIQQGGAVQRSAAGGELTVQRDEAKKSWWESLTDSGESAAWDMVRAVAPAAVPIIQKGPAGVLDWIGEKISSAADAVFNTVMAPVRAISGIGDTLSAIFAPMIVTLQTAAGNIARNDCSPIKDAADKIEKTALRILTPIVEKLQPVVAKVKGFLNDVWDVIGEPIWEAIKKYAQDQWNQIKWLAGIIADFYTWIWDKTAWIRSMAEKAWNWIKDKLGIGEGCVRRDVDVLAE